MSRRSLQGAFVLGGGVLSFGQVSFGVRGAEIQMAGTNRLVHGTVDFAGTARMNARVCGDGDRLEAVAAQENLNPLFANDGAGTLLPIRRDRTGQQAERQGGSRKKIFHRGDPPKRRSPELVTGATGAVS